MASPAEGITTLIRTGVADDFLDEIQEAISVRRTFLNAQAALSMSKGTRIRINSGKYEGYAGTVVEVKRTRVSIELDRPARGSKLWTYPADMLDVISGTAQPRQDTRYM